MLGKLNHPSAQIFILILLTLAMVLPGLASLPVVDRDEARFAQASVQMADTNDLLNIKFQDEARNKKPAAAYWAQTAMIETFARDGENKIWIQRLPSALAAIISVLALYWGASRMVGRRAGFIACALLATSLVFVFEGHIAKTDALLCASTTVMFASLGRLRHGKGRLEIWGFWIALGLSIMIKGPIGPALALCSLLSLWIWERNLTWARPLIHWGGMLVFVLIWLPWAIAIFVATDGAFFIESLGNDFGGKVVSGQESHGALPGSHSAVIWITLWPASLFLLPAIAYAVSTLRKGADNQISRTLRFALSWSLSFWVLIELMPTKLPHYGLPVFPALCLIMGAAIVSISASKGFKKTRVIGGGLFILSTVLILILLIGVQSQFGSSSSLAASYIICGAAGIVACIAGYFICQNKIISSVGAALLSSIILTIGTYSLILPSLPALNTSERIAAELDAFAPDVARDKIYSPHFREPSLVYHVGTQIHVKGTEVDLSDGTVAIIDLMTPNSGALIARLEQSAESRGECVESSSPLDGFNYSKGDRVALIILKSAPC